MTIRLIDGFDYFPLSSYGTLSQALGWSGLNGNFFPYAADTAFGYGNALRYDVGSANSVTMTKWLRGRYTGTYIMGMRIKVPTTVSAGYFIHAQDSMSSSTDQWRIMFDSQGQLTIQYVIGTTETTYMLTKAFTYVPGAWFYFEIKVTPGITTGALEIRINTEVVYSGTGLRTANGTVFGGGAYGVDFFKLFFSHLGSGAEDGWMMDDFYFLTCDGAINNDYLGNTRVKYMAVTGQSTVQFAIGGTAPAATNWQSVLNTALNDTKYVYSTTAGDKDYYTVNPVVNAPYVHAVQVEGSYKQDDATQRWAKNIIQSAGVDAEGVSHALNQSYSFYGDIYQLNPATGNAFTGTEANAILIGPKVDV